MDVFAYLDEKELDPKEWLRREPRSTHPDILGLVRSMLADGLHYDSDLLRHAAEALGVEETRHLGSEIYVARGIIRDEEAATKMDQALEDGYAPLSFADLTVGTRYAVRFGTVYAGRTVPEYGDPVPVRAASDQGRVVLMPKGAKTRYIMPSGPALVKAL